MVLFHQDLLMVLHSDGLKSNHYNLKFNFILMKNRYIALAVLAMGSGSVFAQVSKKDTLTTQNIQAVTIIGKQNKSKAITSISRDYLDVIKSNTLGETLSKISGIQNNYYGPNAGTPMIRSLAGNRVKILRNGIAMNDLSGISPDYNVDFDAESTQRMEVYKNSAAVLYGGKAIGGAVNIQNRSLPVQRFDSSASATLLLEGTSNDGFQQSLKVEGNVGKKLSWHISASARDRDFVKIPSETKSDYCRDPRVVGFSSIMQAMCQMNVVSGHRLNVTLFPYLNQFVLDNIDNPVWELSENDKYTFEAQYFDRATMSYKDNPKNPLYVAGQDPEKDRYISYVESINDWVKTSKGRMPNSHAEKRSANLGISYIGDRFYTGIGYEGHYSYYGIPGYAYYGEVIHRHSHGSNDHSNDEVSTILLPINIDLRNHRFISESGMRFSDFFIKSMKLKYAGQYSENTELLGDKHANLFKINQHGVRWELEQQKRSFLSGTSGIDFEYRKMEGSGKHRYMPNSLSKEIGLFTLQHLNFHFLSLDLGFRHDEVVREALPSTGYVKGRGRAGGNLQKRFFGLNQFNISARWNVFKNYYINARFNHSERAPEVNELYMGNDHFALLIEENGDDQLNKEQATALELGIGVYYKNLKISASVYRTYFQNYMYLGHTGITRNGFVVREWRAGNTQVEGVEANAAYQWKLNENAAIELTGFFDWVRNKNTSDDEFRKRTDGDFMPNMPTSRLGLGISGAIHRFTANISWDKYLEQKYLGRNIDVELPMPAYHLMSARLSYRAKLSKMPMEFYLFGTNLLNETARPQNSLLKYIAPLPGINIGLGVKATL